MKNYVREERTKKELTQVQLSEMVNVSRQTIISIETSRYTPSVILAIKLATVLGKKVETLFEVEMSD
jgi:putative transcriptional regulator